MKFLIALALGLLILTGCGGKATEPFKDSPTEPDRNNSPAQIGEMPDGFNNWASKCDGPNRVYVTFHGDAAYGGIFVVKDDPRCASQ